MVSPARLSGTLAWTQGVEPVLRTYNTLIIACNMCNQPREAMAVHKRMLDEGYTPNATTYNALISAHGKAGQLDKVGQPPLWDTGTTPHGSWAETNPVIPSWSVLPVLQVSACAASVRAPGSGCP